MLSLIMDRFEKISAGGGKKVNLLMMFVGFFFFTNLHICLHSKSYLSRVFTPACSLVKNFNPLSCNVNLRRVKRIALK